MNRTLTLICVLALIGHAVALGNDDLTPLVTIKPAVVTFHPGKDFKSAVWQDLNLSITNRTSHTRHFNNFYFTFWVPMLLSEDGTPMRTG